ncbi:hypothetical protein CIT292_06303 [Citrobacter youngae ATCC 29220]|uniref:Uncharacterized protein n=1 Tax=Citrobacter youngae ATCC 29220 TaxID=500640 RepID=D4B7K5_9ENTR|nr:hypothetical protein CIT292_06303 [Citrobacter youngae ATCC 29220]
MNAGWRRKALSGPRINPIKKPRQSGVFFNFQAITRERSRCESASA